MKVVVTGSLGYVSNPLINKLVANDHEVVVVTRDENKVDAIKKLHATPAVGSMDDENFLVNTFTGADAVYCMLAPYGNFSDPKNDANAIVERAKKYAYCYVSAIQKAGVEHVVYLSSIGAEKASGNGLIKVHYYGEQIFRTLPDNVSVSFIRPAGYFKNLFLYMHQIKNEGVIKSNYGAGDEVAWVSNYDIAEAIVKSLESNVGGKQVHNVVSEIISCNALASILGKSIGLDELTWDIISGKEQLDIYMQHGMNESVATQFVEMNQSIHTGSFYDDYNANKTEWASSRLADFSKEFADMYNSL